MVVTKRQRKGKVRKNGTQETSRTRVRTSGETDSLPGWPSLHTADSGRAVEDTKHVKRRSQDRLRPLLWGRPALTPRGCTVLRLPDKTLSCN